MGTPIPSTPPVDPCGYCTETPLALKLTITNMNGNGCSCCKVSDSPPPGRWRGVNLTNVDAEYILPQNPDYPCSFDKEFTGNFGTINNYDDNVCTSLVSSWTIKKLGIYVLLGSGGSTVIILVYAYDNSTLQLSGWICHYEPFTNKSGEDCGVWDPTDFSAACFATPPWCYGVQHLASGGTLQCERIP